MQKTNAIRMLEKAKIAFDTKEYAVDESDLSGVHVAQSVGMKKKYPTYIDTSAQNFDRIAVSGGARGLQIIIDIENLLSFADAVLTSLTVN